MNAPEFEEAQVLWKMFYASECFRQARNSAHHIHEQKMEKDNPLFHPLVVATYVLYAKPFTRSDGVGRLGEEIVPKEHLPQHQLLIEHRHQLYAHRDADGFSVGEYGPVNQVRVLRTQQFMQLYATEFHARFYAMPPIIALCGILEEKTNYHVKKLWDKHKAKIPQKVGEYMLNVLDQNADIWLLQKPMILPDGAA